AACGEWVEWVARRAAVAPGATPARPARRREFAQALQKQGNFLDRIGRVETSVRSYEEAIQEFDRLAADVPAEAQHGANARMDLAMALQRAGNADRANRLADEAVEITRRIASSGKPADRRGLAGRLSGQGLVRWHTGRLNEADSALDEAVAILREL